METEHFGGTPWKTEIKPLTDPNHIVISNNEGYPIAKVQWPDDPGFQQIANLIATAPELYRIAKFFEFALRDLMNVPGYKWYEVKRMIESALAKTGEAK